jgi:hypothetical protein
MRYKGNGRYTNSSNIPSNLAGLVTAELNKVAPGCYSVGGNGNITYTHPSSGDHSHTRTIVIVGPAANQTTGFRVGVRLEPQTRYFRLAPNGTCNTILIHERCHRYCQKKVDSYRSRENEVASKKAYTESMMVVLQAAGFTVKEHSYDISRFDVEFPNGWKLEMTRLRSSKSIYCSAEFSLNIPNDPLKTIDFLNAFGSLKIPKIIEEENPETSE